jgi:hypothetical protein
MFTHYDFKHSKVTVTFSTTQDADDIIRDLESCTVRSGHFCDVQTVTVTETRKIRRSIRKSPAMLREDAENLIQKIEVLR